MELCLNDSKKRLRSGLVKQHGNGCSWSHLRDGTYAWVKWSASDGSCYGSVGLVFRLMKPVIALEGYGGSIDLYSGTRIVGTLGVSSDIGAVEISEFTVVSGVGMEVAAPTLTVYELMVALVVATLLAVLVWLGGECVLMAFPSCWDWMIGWLVLCSVVFDVEDGVMKEHQTHHHQKHHHKHFYACVSLAPTVWSLLCLGTRQPSYYASTLLSCLLMLLAQWSE